MTDEERIRDMVRRVVYRAVGASPRPSVGRGPMLITELHVEETPAGTELVIPEGALVTPLARQAAIARRITLVESGSVAQAGPETERCGALESAADRTVAVGSDHGGFELKEALKEHLDGLGFAVLDCGTDSPDPADYPEFALAVALAVTEGRAWSGIAIDGAGIGSCMAANKVPGVRAALVHSPFSAQMAKQHNDANIIALGGRTNDAKAARELVGAWLDLSLIHI